MWEEHIWLNPLSTVQVVSRIQPCLAERNMKESVGGMEKETQQSSLAHDLMIQQQITEGSFSRKMAVALQHYSSSEPDAAF